MPLTADLVFQAANLCAVAGWLALALALGVILKNALLRDRIAGWVWPTLLAIAYVAIMGALMTGAIAAPEGGDFSSLAGVMAFFASPWAATVGWIHYLAFDLFVGVRITQDAERDGVARRWLIPILPLTFLLGPAGLLAFNVVRVGVGRKAG
ncbi:MAG: hypothetical protein FD160_3163 [Caulobacteraceae bacterium]|nr:MAG: hypothetical protein FD160_3163 [Caulobacteraceae bacterium]